MWKWTQTTTRTWIHIQNEGYRNEDGEMDLDFHEDADAETDGETDEEDVDEDVDEEADEDVDEDEVEDGLSLALPAKVRWRPRRCDCNKEAAAMKLFPPT